MRTTRYFAEQVLRKRPYLTLDLCAAVLANPIVTTLQADGRIRIWGRVRDPRDETDRILRVVLLGDGETIHNAFYDRGFREGAI